MRAAGGLGVPAGFDQTQERLEVAGHRRRALRCVIAVVVIVFPLGDQRLAVAGQRRLEFGRFQVGQGDAPRGELLVAGLGDRGPRVRAGIGVGSRFELDRGAQLVDRGDPRQLGVVLVGSVGCSCGDDTDLIQRQPALLQLCYAAGEGLPAARHGGDRRGVGRRGAQLPRHQRRHRPGARGAAQLVAIHLSDNVHDAPVDRVALTGQLRQLLEQHLKTLIRRYSRAERCGQGHNSIIAPGYDKTRPRQTTHRTAVTLNHPGFPIQPTRNETWCRSTI